MLAQNETGRSWSSIPFYICPEIGAELSACRRRAEGEASERRKRPSVSSSLGGRRQGEGRAEPEKQPARYSEQVSSSSDAWPARRFRDAPGGNGSPAFRFVPAKKNRKEMEDSACGQRHRRRASQILPPGGRDASRKPPTSAVDARPRHHRSVPHPRRLREETGDVHAEDAPTPRTRSPKPSRATLEATLTLPSYTRECQITATEGKETTGHVFASWYRDSPRSSQRDLLKETSVDSACEEGGARWGQK
ncbi:hypothetical protein IscW_ISCW013391 [Ixodes scapularis]|uniref:Uncharacterized protein n=1 Tax=Ixodes scapularis TaxID=6945 RepID=B7QDR0_IXOSC|nr:hypothetical protein IscW_ISCW013391 [Ixodes scapularis]|eukprot:XP_002413674.1 hypothetical protein IscW_ISCW013391 [Ixodes scapularis]